MMTTVLLMALVLAVGTQASDAIRVKQEEAILRKLSVPEAADYYQVLRRRVRRVRILRAITLAGLLLAMLAARRRYLAPIARPPVTEASRSEGPSNTDAAKALAQAELARHAARGTVDPARLELRGVSGDDRHPWIFDYVPTAGTGERIRIYVDRAGRTELHRIP